jgi:2-methylcitrate dehydratase PrpD
LQSQHGDGLAPSTRFASAEAGRGATRKLAEHAAALTYSDLPPELIRLVKQCVLDTLGVIVGASGIADEGRIVAEFVLDQGGSPESSLLGFGGKVPAPAAAFVNGGLGHMLDYDDVGDGGHVSICTIPPALAIAEKVGTVHGRDFITAIAAGTDIHTRLALAIDVPDWTMSEGWFATQMLGFVSGAATAGRVLRLDAEQMENALGIGFNQMSGSRQMAVGTATHMRSMQAGFSGQAATAGALLAQRGLIGSKEFVEGCYGLFHNYVRTPTPHWDAITGELGRRFPLLQTHGFKVWPACAYTRPTNAAVLHLRSAHAIRPEDVATVTVIGGTGGTQLLCEPLEGKRRPRTSIDGKYSIPFTTAVMMQKGNVGLRDYTDDGLRDPAVLAMADRVSYRARSGSEAGRGGSGHASSTTAVEIRTRDGRVFVHQPDGVPGDPRHPVEDALLEAKFRDCVSFSATPIAAGKIDHVIDMIRNLERVTDVAELARTLTP